MSIKLLKYQGHVFVHFLLLLIQNSSLKNTVRFGLYTIYLRSGSPLNLAFDTTHPRKWHYDRYIQRGEKNITRQNPTDLEDHVHTFVTILKPSPL